MAEPTKIKLRTPNLSLEDSVDRRHRLATPRASFAVRSRFPAFGSLGSEARSWPRGLCVRGCRPLRSAGVARGLDCVNYLPKFAATSLRRGQPLPTPTAGEAVRDALSFAPAGPIPRGEGKRSPD